MIIGGVVPVVNVKGVGPGQLHLDGATVAASIWATSPNGMTRRSRRLNPKLALPSTAIAPVYRSDGSGTNFLFSDYLSKSSPKFASTIGANSSVQWPIGIGAKGNEGVANMTTQTDGAIGYVEYAYAKQNKMAFTLLTNKSGGVVSPSADSFPGRRGQRGLGEGRFLLLDPDRPGGRQELADYGRELHSGVPAALRRCAG